ncbi:hypothetical protein M9434_003552 [Picochlorum sp. BPE23]|nr:hypothetical protein M9434_003552 [Picochlorum sp. BPE23]
MHGIDESGGGESVVMGEEDDFYKRCLPSLGHFPRSDASIAVALNELDAMLEAEDGTEEDVSHHSAQHVEKPPSGAQVSTREQGVGSHPVDFALEFPRICIVTTASLPWLTGTAVNPALRGAYLWNQGHHVTLLVPWVKREEQGNIFQKGVEFDSEKDQLEAVRTSLSARVPFDITWGDEKDEDGSGSPRYHIRFYSGKYAPALGSIIPTQDIQPLVPQDVSCIVLEEPEHLTWYHSGKRWIRAFDSHVPVVGVMHTNYVDYARRMAGDAASVTLKQLNKFLCRQHTHKVIKLSAAVQKLPREEVCFVHGVSEGFLRIGKSVKAGEVVFGKAAYFLGKALWAKGFEELLDKMEAHEYVCAQNGKETIRVDVYGHGKELEEIQNESSTRGLSLNFLGPKDHLSEDMAAYRVFVNPSTSDVVATTSAEALAMGKWLLVPRHPCNAFFADFQNCLVYENDDQFSDMLIYAAHHDPQPLSESEINRLTWECATDRLLLCCSETTTERSKRLGFERVACKTSWLGYNVGYGVYSIVTKAIDSVVGSIQTSQSERVRGRLRPPNKDDGLQSHAL